jgi:hypothetical protein
MNHPLEKGEVFSSIGFIVRVYSRFRKTVFWFSVKENLMMPECIADT